MSDAPFDLNQANRWFAVELNNKAWHWMESSPRDPGRSAEMVHAAHASCWHWTQAGGPIHRARAEYLVAAVHVLSGHAGATQRHLFRARKILDDHPEEVADWDRAFLADITARSYAAAGDESRARRAREEADRLGEAIADPEDRKVFEAWRRVD